MSEVKQLLLSPRNNDSRFTYSYPAFYGWVYLIFHVHGQSLIGQDGVFHMLFIELSSSFTQLVLLGKTGKCSFLVEYRNRTNFLIIQERNYVNLRKRFLDYPARLNLLA